MNALRDSLIALIFAAMIGVMALRISGTTREHVIKTRQALATQESMNTMTEILEYDIRKIGHGLINPFAGISLANDSHIKLAYDKDPSSNYDSVHVEYYTIAATATPNPNDKILIRKLNSNNARSGALGLTNLTFKYFNAFGVQLPTPVCADSLPKIREIEISIELENTHGFKNKYAKAKFVTRIIPKNLLIRFSN